MRTDGRVGEPAVRAGQDPRERARLLRTLRDQVLHGQTSSPGLRRVIADSWERLRHTGFDPSGRGDQEHLDGHHLKERRSVSPLADVLPAVTAHLRDAADAVGQVVVIADAGGAVLWREGPPAARRRADSLGFTEGSVWTEGSVGTNAIGTALVVDTPVHVFAGEHLAETHQPWTCAAAPVHDPTGQVLGVVDLSGPAHTVHAGTLALVSATARVAELEIAALHERRHRALTAFTAPDVLVLAQDGCLVGGAGIGGAGTGGAPIHVHDGFATVPGVGRFRARELPGGWLLSSPAPNPEPMTLELVSDGIRCRTATVETLQPLSPRHRELVTLLAGHPQGLSATQVARHLFGDADRRVSARAELSRLRRILGPVLLSRPYRLSCPVLT